MPDDAPTQHDPSILWCDEHISIRSLLMRLHDLDFHLPPQLIAQSPAAERAASRLLHYDRGSKAVTHATFSDLPRFLRPGDLLVFNDARVIPARFTLRKDTGGHVEGLFISETADGEWIVLLKNLGPIKPNHSLHFLDAPEIWVRVMAKESDAYRVKLNSDKSAIEILSAIGRMPLPPYIKRAKDHDDRDDFDRERYQTVYAKASGAVAAPTAGLHFTPELLTELEKIGVQKTFVTLHVGLGTFKPIEVENPSDHPMHSEMFSIPQESADAINLAKRENRRVIAVGTTAARVLESQPAGEPIVAKSDATSIFIFPPYDWKFVDAMITNFHLPKSTLIALVAAMVGLEEQRRIYEIAIAESYRFFSYGDAMFIE